MYVCVCVFFCVAIRFIVLLSRFICSKWNNIICSCNVHVKMTGSFVLYSFPCVPFFHLYFFKFYSARSLSHFFIRARTHIHTIPLVTLASGICGTAWISLNILSEWGCFRFDAFFLFWAVFFLYSFLASLYFLIKYALLQRINHNHLGNFMNHVFAHQALLLLLFKCITVGDRARNEFMSCFVKRVQFN